ncbi:MAG: erythromycin esterase family protein [Nitrososphaeraceae archaeon]
MYNLEKPDDLNPFFKQVEKDNVRYVLLGEASHGTSEFYKWRAEITKRLFSENGFSFIAVEGDWPVCYRVNRYVKGMSASNENAYDVLYSFNRWPTWMWAKKEILDLIEWLREYNIALPEEQKVGFYGLDVYSLWESLDAVIKYLKKADPQAVQTAIHAYRCFEPYEESVEDYARATAFVPDSCEDEVIEMLIDLHSKASQYRSDGLAKKEAYFNAEQNAIVTRNAELYYRKMIQGGTSTWNIRDTHMMDTLTRLMEFHDTDSAKSIVWAHNTHIGDARFTDMTQANMVNLGQLVRQQAGQEKALLVGFGTYSGTVIAAREWGERMEKMNVPPAVQGSWDNVIHKLSDGRNSLLVFRKNKSEEYAKEEYRIYEAPEENLRAEKKRGQRAIGVVYNPEHERYGNYVPTVLTDRYDAFVYLDK